MKKNLKHYLDRKTDRALLVILFFEKKKYEKEALQCVKEIIKERNLTKEQIDKHKKEICKARRKEKHEQKKSGSDNGGCLEVILELFLS